MTFYTLTCSPGDYYKIISKRLASVSLFLYLIVMKKYIEVKLEIEGLHHWPDCNLPHVDYLAHLHRHTFIINCRAEVSHGNRDIEFIDFKHKVKKYIANRWYDPAYGCCNFGPMSCEMIAEDILNEYGLCRCSVSEDDEFFGIVEA